MTVRSWQLLTWIFAIAAVLGALYFTAAFLANPQQAFKMERAALVPLIAGIAAAVSRSRDRKTLSLPAAAISLVLLGGWCLYLAATR